MSVRAGIVVTGTEVLTGRVADLNGPWVADRLLELGVELAHITICGDRAADIEAQLRFPGRRGRRPHRHHRGLGPTADDMTVQTVADFAGRDLVLDAELEAKIAAILKSLMARFTGVDFEAVMAANRKQAMVPLGADVLDPVGTAPGWWCPARRRCWCCPDRRGSCRPCGRPRWPVPWCNRRSPGARSITRRRCGSSAFPSRAWPRRCARPRGVVSGFADLEITTCPRRGEVEMVTRYEPHGAEAYRRLMDLMRERHGSMIFSEDGSLVDDQVARLLEGRRIATAESCTAGLLAARLTDRPGSRRTWPVGWWPMRIRPRSTCSVSTRRSSRRTARCRRRSPKAMALGAVERFGADTAVAITGVAGPDGGTPEKPVGTVWFCVRLAEGVTVIRSLQLPGARSGRPGAVHDGGHAPVAAHPAGRIRFPHNLIRAA